MTTVLGALPSNCAGGVRKLEGLTVGGGSTLGKPCDRRTSGTLAQPGVGALVVGATQVKARPGCELAAAAAAKVAMGSKEIPQPAWTTVFDPNGVQLMPIRGAIALLLERFHQLSARTNDTGPSEPLMFLLGT